MRSLPSNKGNQAAHLSLLILRKNLERETGIEPATNGLGSRDSTTELLPLGVGEQSVTSGE
jgi:hypothetical protein